MRQRDPCHLGLAEYLGGHLTTLACSLLACALAWPLLAAMGLGLQERALLVGLLALALALVQASSWARERGWVEDARRLAAAGDDAMALASELEADDSLEASAMAGAVHAVAADAARQVGQAHQAQQDYRDFVETWVHEVKTPLAAADLFVQNADDPSLRPLARELARTEAYVEQALFYARSTSVENDYLVRTQALEPLVAEAVRSRRGQLIEAHVAVDLGGLSREDGTPVEVPCDPKWLVFILGQLIDNAVRYRADPARDGRAPRIAFSATEEDLGKADERVTLHVRDNGCGIAAADLPRVFDRGFTGQNGRTRQRSTGMGLYLVATLCHKMGMAVAADSHEGEWTEVTMAFPRDRSRGA